MDEWRNLAPLPDTIDISGGSQGLQHFSLAAYRGHIYRIGGGYFTPGTDDFQYEHVGRCYDPATDSWRTVVPINENRANAATFVYDGKLYVIGNTIPGKEYGFYMLPSIECFDADSQTLSLVGGNCSQFTCMLRLY